MLKGYENTNCTRLPCTVELVIGCYNYVHHVAVTDSITEYNKLIVSDTKDIVVYFDYHLIRLVHFLFTGVGGLRNVVVDVPVAVKPGATVTLQCSYDLEGDELYTVKWYKGKHEFFRYVPKELPHTRVFPLPGVNVDVSPNVCHGLLSLYSCRFTTL
jgi:Immunoglobulin V-set domain.